MSKTTDVREAVMVGRRSDGSLVRRPLSPHLQAYDMLQMTSALSITHRITGVVWSVGPGVPGVVAGRRRRRARRPSTACSGSSGRSSESWG